MREMGIRELKASLSQTLRAVAGGEQVRVTMRGRAIADIVPAAASRGEAELRDLVAQGRVVLPTRARPTRPPRLAKGRTDASVVVVADRDAER